MRIFLDANILFSAARSDGAIRRLLELLVERGHELVADEYVLEEARRNLGVDDQKWATVKVFRIPKTSPLPADINLVEKDRPVLASAIGLRCDALVTGDKAHFGHLYGSSLEGVAVHSPRSIAELLLG